MTTYNAPIRIDIKLANATRDQPTFSREKPASPTKTPEEQHKFEARHALLAKLELEAKIERAHRSAERAKETHARKLRLEAQKVARAEAALERAKSNNTKASDGRAAKRDAAVARRTATFDAVRAAREQREMAKQDRAAMLNERDTKASKTHAKAMETIVAKAKQEVKHAKEVVQSTRQKAEEALTMRSEALAMRLGAAQARREEVLAATVDGAASVGRAAEKTRLKHLTHERAVLEERRAKLVVAMKEAEERRSASLAARQLAAASENARVADVVEEGKLATESTPARLRCRLVARLQAAEVSRQATLQSKAAGTNPFAVGQTAAIGVVAPETAIPGVPGTVPGTGKIQWLGLEGGAGRTMATPPEAEATDKENSKPPSPLRKVAARKAPVVIFIAADDAQTLTTVTASPPEPLLRRLLFRPRMLLATGKARQLAAAGRRRTQMRLVQARAAHYGTTRVAAVTGRRAAYDEARRTLLSLHEAATAQRASKALLATAAVARTFNERVVRAKLCRSGARLQMLNAAIKCEERRLAGSLKRDKAVLTRSLGRVAAAAVAAVRTRRAAQDEAVRAAGATTAKRALDATARREALLSSRVAKAKLASMKYDTPSKLTTRPDKTVALVLPAPPSLSSPSPQADLEERIAAQNKQMAALKPDVAAGIAKAAEVSAAAATRAEATAAAKAARKTARLQKAAEAPATVIATTKKKAPRTPSSNADGEAFVLVD